jgi:kumamolisin
MTAYVPVGGSQRALLPGSEPAGPVDPNEISSLTIRLRSRGDPKTLVSKAYELARQPLAHRQYLTRQDLADQHGAEPADLEVIEQFAQSHNLVVVHQSAAARSLVLKGKLGDLLNAFHADIQMYRHSTGAYRGRRGEILVPQELAPLITGVFGFDTRRKHREPQHLKSAAVTDPGTGHGVPATQFATRYNFPDKQGDTVLDGTGQTLALIELGGGFQDSDLQSYFQELDLPVPTVTAVSVDGATNSPTTSRVDDGEVMLDILVAGAVIPKANIVVYFAPSTEQGFIDAISAAVHDTARKPSVVSISWGGPESTSDTQGFTACHEIFSAAAALGITVCAASGDHGPADLSATDWDHAIHVNHPSSDDLVLSCGGTQIDPVSGKDVVWNDNTPFDPTVHGGGGWASGGGVSKIFPVPDYQSAANVPVSLDGGQPGRGLPDIAMSARNYLVRVDSSDVRSGGTSAVAPLMAALIVRLNQAKGKNVGFLNPFLYTNAANGVVVGVTDGSNTIPNTVQGYNATPGWNACTGLGTPDGTAILNKL